MFSRPRQKQRHTGFTIIELLVVIVVIGILAAVSIATYASIQGKARSTQYISAMDAWEKLIRLYEIQHGHYPIIGNSIDASYCLGADTSAEPELPEGSCLTVNGEDLLGSYRYNQAFIDLMKAEGSIPTTSLKSTLIPAGEDYTFRARGILYYVSTSSNINDGEVSLTYFIPEDQPCGRGVRAVVDYGNGISVTSCKLVLSSASN